MLTRPQRVLIVLILALCAACTPAPPPAPPGAVTLPPRPYDVAIDGIPPCELLTPAQLAALGLDGQPLERISSTRLLGDAPTCSVVGFQPRAVGTSISLVVEFGIERYTTGELDGVITPVTIAGFPAVSARPSLLDTNCTAAVDVAPGRMLDVIFSDGGRQPPIPQDQLCRDAIAVAEQVMRTLLAR